MGLLCVFHNEATDGFTRIDVTHYKLEVVACAFSFQRIRALLLKNYKQQKPGIADETCIKSTSYLTGALSNLLIAQLLASALQNDEKEYSFAGSVHSAAPISPLLCTV